VIDAITGPLDSYLAGIDADTFDLDRYLARAVPDVRLLDDPEGRRALTRLDPLLFGIVYLRHHLRDAEGRVSFGDAHLDWCRAARSWIRRPTEPGEHRDAWIAPRNTGKSTWWFLILPMWAAANGFVRFVAAFSASAAQAETHLSTFKQELDTNDRLREDFPRLCTPAKRMSGQNLADTQRLFIASCGFAFAARGMDSSSLGLKIGERRPDLLLLDDVEPDESSYSPAQASKRLTTLKDAILQLNIYARVTLVGTVTMPGSIVHQLVKHARGTETADWIRDEGFRAHYSPPIIRTDDGAERSMWPAKWPLAYLKSIEHTRSYAKNYANDPMGADGDYWCADDFRYGTEPVTHMMLSIDPAVTAKATSDFTGLGVVSWSAQSKACTVHAAIPVRIPPGTKLRERVLAVLDEYPEIGLIVIETNQGGDAWQAILHGMPVKVKALHQREPKEVRAARVLNHYQRGRVLHARPLRDLEEQMVAFPKAPHDDLVDCVGSAVSRFLDPPKREAPPTASRQSYVGRR
jgi:predicted phage terminase large subunit-like protein